MCVYVQGTTKAYGACHPLKAHAPPPGTIPRFPAKQHHCHRPRTCSCVCMSSHMHMHHCHCSRTCSWSLTVCRAVEYLPDQACAAAAAAVAAAAGAGQVLRAVAVREAPCSLEAAVAAAAAAVQRQRPGLCAEPLQLSVLSPGSVGPLPCP